MLHHAPIRTTTISEIPEEGPPTPPTRRKRGKPVKISKTHQSSGESTPSGGSSPKKGNLSSTDSSPSVNRVTKTSSSENSPLVNRMTKQEVTTSDVKPIGHQKNEETLSTSLVTKEKVSSTPSGHGNTKGSVTDSFLDEVMKHVDSKTATSDYHLSTDLQCNDDTGPLPSVVKAEDTTDARSSTTSNMIAMMKNKGHTRTHSAPVLDEEGSTSPNKTVVTTVDVVSSSFSDHQQGKESKEKRREGSKEDKVAPPIVVHYLGPLVLRKEVESLLIREGLSYLEQKDFPLLSPTVFWNLVSVTFASSVSVTTSLHIYRCGTSLDLVCHLTYPVKPLSHSLTSLRTRYSVTTNSNYTLQCMLTQ